MVLILGAGRMGLSRWRSALSGLGFPVGGVTKLDGRAGAGIDATEIERGKLGSADDVRNEDEDNFVVDDLMLLLAEDVLQQRQLAQAGDAGYADQILFLQDAGKDGGLALAQADGLLRGFVGDDGLGDAADGYLVG